MGFSGGMFINWKEWLDRWWNKAGYGRLAPFVIVLVAMRVLNGVIWGSGAAGKNPWNDWGWLPGWLEKEAMYSTLPGYSEFLRNVVLPNIDAFGWFQFLVEAALCAAIVTGTATRLAGVGATLWALNIVLGAFQVPGENILNLGMFVLVPALIASVPTGRLVGVDAVLRPKWIKSDISLLKWVAKWGM